MKSSPAVTSKDDLDRGIALLRQLTKPPGAGEMKPFVGELEAAALLAEIERLRYDLKVQKGVNDLAYIPHRHLVEQNDKLRARVAELEKAAPETSAELEQLRRIDHAARKVVDFGPASVAARRRDCCSRLRCV